MPILSRSKYTRAPLILLSLSVALMLAACNGGSNVTQDGAEQLPPGGSSDPNPVPPVVGVGNTTPVDARSAPV